MLAVFGSVVLGVDVIVVVVVVVVAFGMTPPEVGGKCSSGSPARGT